MNYAEKYQHNYLNTSHLAKGYPTDNDQHQHGQYGYSSLQPWPGTSSSRYNRRFFLCR